MRKLLTSLTLALATLPGVAHAAEPCLTPAEFSSLATYGLPSIIKGVSERCRPSLGASGWLPRNGAQLSARYAQSKPAAWPAAKAAVFKMFGPANGSGKDQLGPFRSLPDAQLQPIADGLIEGMMSQQVPVERCQTIDRVVSLVSPLPPQNTAELIALTAGLASQSGGGLASKLKLCAA